MLVLRAWVRGWAGFLDRMDGILPDGRDRVFLATVFPSASVMQPRTQRDCLKQLADDVSQAANGIKVALDRGDADLIQAAKDGMNEAADRLTTELYKLTLERDVIERKLGLLVPTPPREP